MPACSARQPSARSLALNSMDGFTAAYLGFQIAYSGDWERGCALAVRFTQLNPNHPGWYWFPLFLTEHLIQGLAQGRIGFALDVERNRSRDGKSICR